MDRSRGVGALRGAALIAASAAATGCAPHPELAVPPTALSSDWQAHGALGGSAEPLDSSWTAFHSSELERLIARAREANPDIAIARARILQARGQLGVARAALAPALAVSAGGAMARTGVRNAPDVRSDSHDVGIDIAWDIDLFGQARAGKRAARARLAAAAFDRDAIGLAIESEVARAFIDYAALTDRIALLDRSLDNAREVERIIEIRVREGVATRVESGIQTIEVRRIEAQRSDLVEARIHARNALAVLVGEEAPGFALPEIRLADLTPPFFRPVQPGELLVRRPDIRSAEALIRASEGDIGQARAAFLPSLRISARSAGEAVAGGPLQLLLSAGASLLAPIFDGGRLRGNMMTATGHQREAVETYRKALLTAFGESEDALTAIDQSQLRVALLSETIEEARTTARLARRQFVEGAADLQTVLDAERGLLALEEAHAIALQERLDAAVDLYRAMGGTPVAA